MARSAAAVGWRVFKATAVMVGLGSTASVGFALYVAHRFHSPPVRTIDGKERYTFVYHKGGVLPKRHTVDLVLAHEAEAKLRANETKSEEEMGRGHPVCGWHRNWVGANEPCEDRSAVDVWSRDAAFFSVLDGHIGHETAEYVSKVLHDTLFAGLQEVRGEEAAAAGGWWGRRGRASGEYTERVKHALADAWERIDADLMDYPLSHIPKLGEIPDGPRRRRAESDAAVMCGLAKRGACALTVMVDAEREDVYVLSAGDCRAIAGWEKDGMWRCDQLSEDHTGSNVREVQRLEEEHPGEAGSVVVKGKVHGEMRPTRAFGDSIYKWTRDEHAQVNDWLQTQWPDAKLYPQSRHNKTPPYITARPDVTHRKIRPDTGERLRFIVLATDGLWDRLSSEETTRLIASYLEHRTRAPILKTDLPLKIRIPDTEWGVQRTVALQATAGGSPRDHERGAWVYKGDENAATHLIRNSFGAADETKTRALMSLEGKVTRALRDDTTVMVVFFDEEDRRLV